MFGPGFGLSWLIHIQKLIKSIIVLKIFSNNNLMFIPSFNKPGSSQSNFYSNDVLNEPELVKLQRDVDYYTQRVEREQK